jgi:hypothetical protein
MYFNDLNIGAAVAILENKKNEQAEIDTKLFSEKAIDKLKLLEKKINDTENNSNSLFFNTQLESNDESIENFLLYLFTQKNKEMCETFFNIILNSYALFEHFCNFYRDYLNAKIQFNTNLKEN